MRRTRSDILPSADDGADADRSPCRSAVRGARSARSCSTACASKPGGELALLDRADELGRQLSSAIENMQLLEDVQRSRRELENTFDSIAHLVVVYDLRGRIVRANEAFASRLKLTREQLIDRPLAECVGPELIAWLAAHDALRRAADRRIGDPRNLRPGPQRAVHRDR